MRVRDLRLPEQRPDLGLEACQLRRQTRWEEVCPRVGAVQNSHLQASDEVEGRIEVILLRDEYWILLLGFAVAVFELASHAHE